MAHASRKIVVTTSGTTNWKKTPKTYDAQQKSYGYPTDSTDLTRRARNDAADAYRKWLRTKVADEREMLYLSLSQSHRIQYD